MTSLMMAIAQLNPVNQLCTGCGICVSESGGSLKMDWDEHGFLIPHIAVKTVSTDVLKVCPFNPNPEDAVQNEDKLAEIFLAAAPKYEPLVGKYTDTYIGYSKDFRDSSSSGGIATYVLYELLKRKLVEHLFIVVGEGSTFKYRVFSDPEEIKKISKTRYYPVTMEALFVELEKTEGRIAVSGVACFIKALRLKQYYYPDLKMRIPFMLGIICGGLKSRFFTEFLAQSSGIRSGYIDQEYRIKDPHGTASDYSFGATDSNGVRHQMKMSKVGDMWGSGLFKAEACDYCTDVLTELADISVGDAWLPGYRNDGRGNSVVITRSHLAENIIRTGIENGDLVLDQVASHKIVDSQKSSFAHRQDAAQFRNWVARIRRIAGPPTRTRILRSISFPYAIVQLQRLITREKSLSYWKDKADVASFNKRIAKHLAILNGIQKLYHILRSR